METTALTVLEPQRLQIPSTKELKTLGEDLSEKADVVEIKTQTDLESAVELGKKIKQGQKQVTEKYKDRKKYAKEVHSLFCALEKNEMDPFEEAEETLKDKIQLYVTEQEKIRIEAERKALKEAEDRAKAEEEAARKKAEEDQLALAVELEQAGNHEDSAVVMDTPIFVAPVTPIIQQNIIPQKPKAAGLSVPMKYTFVITRPELVPCVWHLLDEKRIQKQVNATGMATRIPGIKIVEERSVRLRA